MVPIRVPIQTFQSARKTLLLITRSQDRQTVEMAKYNVPRDIAASAATGASPPA
jgi:hypothetical protein